MRRLSRALVLALAVLAAVPAISAAGSQSSKGEGGPGAGAEVASPSRDGGATIARILAPTLARPAAGSRRGGTLISPGTAWTQQSTALLVLGAADRDGEEWLRVLLPTRPDGSSGWVPRERVQLNRTPYWIEVHLGARMVDVYRSGSLIRDARAVVGAPATPTPTGLAAIYESVRQADPHNFDGAWVLPLTILSTALRHFEGGPGRIGIHGRAGTSLVDPLGSARSHGCVRVPNTFVSWLGRHLPIGTPVLIRE